MIENVIKIIIKTLRNFFRYIFDDVHMYLPIGISFLFIFGRTTYGLKST